MAKLFLTKLSDKVALSASFVAAFVVALASIAPCAYAAGNQKQNSLAILPPMGWNDWAHYQCNYTAETIVANANALIKTGLSAHGYNTVTIDDCWMREDRDKNGDLQTDPQRFPQGMKPVADAVHALGLKFGIYEDAGFKTCGKFAGSGIPDGGGRDHFLQDARLFASWGVDYLKLDGCNLYVAKGTSSAAAYQRAYAAEADALKSIGRPVIFSESAPAYFVDSPDWYDVLVWVRNYGDLWREGWDIANFKSLTPNASRFDSVLWNYAYNLPLGRFQKPGNWNDPDFVIGGDDGMTLPETRSQMALWAMVSAPLILSSDVSRLSPQAISVLGNSRLIAIDQDVLGKMATLVRRTPAMDLLLKPLSNGDYGVAILNRGAVEAAADVAPKDLGFTSKAECHFDAQDLWSGDRQTSATSLRAAIASHDTAIWRVHPSAACGRPERKGAITMLVQNSRHDIDSYGRCLSASGSVGSCVGVQEESWTVTPEGMLLSGGKCLSAADGTIAMQRCSSTTAQRWRYTLAGNLIDAADDECLTTSDVSGKAQSLSVAQCGHSQPNQIWSLPN